MKLIMIKLIIIEALLRKVLTSFMDTIHMVKTAMHCPCRLISHSITMHHHPYRPIRRKIMMHQMNIFIKIIINRKITWITDILMIIMWWGLLMIIINNRTKWMFKISYTSNIINKICNEETKFKINLREETIIRFQIIRTRLIFLKMTFKVVSEMYLTTNMLEISQITLI